MTIGTLDERCAAGTTLEVGLEMLPGPDVRPPAGGPVGCARPAIDGLPSRGLGGCAGPAIVGPAIGAPDVVGTALSGAP